MRLVHEAWFGTLRAWSTSGLSPTHAVCGVVLGGNMRNLISAIAFAASLASIGSATAQVYPSRPITIVVPYAAGGSTDTIGRVPSQTAGSPARHPTVTLHE
jgi:hypothetical protein